MLEISTSDPISDPMPEKSPDASGSGVDVGSREIISIVSIWVLSGRGVISDWVASMAIADSKFSREDVKSVSEEEGEEKAKEDSTDDGCNRLEVRGSVVMASGVNKVEIGEANELIAADGMGVFSVRVVSTVEAAVLVKDVGEVVDDISGASMLEKSPDASGSGVDVGDRVVASMISDSKSGREEVGNISKATDVESMSSFTIGVLVKGVPVDVGITLGAIQGVFLARTND